MQEGKIIVKRLLLYFETIPSQTRVVRVCASTFKSRSGKSS